MLTVTGGTFKGKNKQQERTQRITQKDTQIKLFKLMPIQRLQKLV